MEYKGSERRQFTHLRQFINRMPRYGKYGRETGRTRGHIVHLFRSLKPEILAPINEQLRKDLQLLESGVKEKDNPIFGQPIKILEPGFLAEGSKNVVARIMRVLKANWIQKVGDLVTKNRDEILRLKMSGSNALGAESLRVIEATLTKRGLHLGMKLD